MMQLIPREERMNKVCHYCDTWVSVKYRIPTEELDRVYYGVSGHVYCCNKCAARHYVGNAEKKRTWVCYYINGKGNEREKVFDNMEDGLAFTQLLDKRIERGTCGGYSFMEV